MKIRQFAAGCALGAAVALVATQAISQDHGQEPSPEQMQEMMAEYMQLLEPGPAHRLLDKSIGTFDVAMKMWWGGPGAEPVETSGTATRKWILDKHYVMEEMKADMMMPDPATGDMTAVPWNGMGLTGYDNFRNMYTSVWADSMSTAMSMSRGSASPDGTTFTYYGELDEPMLGVIGRTIKMVITQKSSDRAVFEMFDLHAGSDYKVMEIVYTRADGGR